MWYNKARLFSSLFLLFFIFGLVLYACEGKGFSQPACNSLCGIYFKPPDDPIKKPRLIDDREIFPPPEVVSHMAMGFYERPKVKDYAVSAEKGKLKSRSDMVEVEDPSVYGGGRPMPNSVEVEDPSVYGGGRPMPNSVEVEDPSVYGGGRPRKTTSSRNIMGRGCCPCGTHSCCGSMCHGKR